MSLQARKYIKHLRTAPNGQKISPAQKSVLWTLADYHSEEKGVAWPSWKTIAQDSCLGSTSYAKKLVRQLEALDLVRRVARKDKNRPLLNQTNLYEFPHMNDSVADEGVRHYSAPPPNESDDGGDEVLGTLVPHTGHPGDPKPLGELSQNLISSNDDVPLKRNGEMDKNILWKREESINPSKKQRQEVTTLSKKDKELLRIYKRALEFYASPGTWHENGTCIEHFCDFDEEAEDGHQWIANGVLDLGRVARTALGRDPQRDPEAYISNLIIPDWPMASGYIGHIPLVDERNIPPLTEDIERDFDLEISDLMERSATTEYDFARRQMREPVLLEIERLWLLANPYGDSESWRDEAERKLRWAHEFNPSWTTGVMLNAVRKRFGSKEDHSETPDKWLERLDRYVETPVA